MPVARDQLLQQRAVLVGRGRVADARPIVGAVREGSIEDFEWIDQRGHEPVRGRSIEVCVEQRTFGGDLKDGADGLEIRPAAGRRPHIDAVGLCAERRGGQLLGDAETGATNSTIRLTGSHVGSRNTLHNDVRRGGQRRAIGAGACHIHERRRELVGGHVARLLPVTGHEDARPLQPVAATAAGGRKAAEGAGERGRGVVSVHAREDGVQHVGDPDRIAGMHHTDGYACESGLRCLLGEGTRRYLEGSGRPARLRSLDDLVHFESSDLENQSLAPRPRAIGRQSTVRPEAEAVARSRSEEAAASPPTSPTFDSGAPAHTRGSRSRG